MTRFHSPSQTPSGANCEVILSLLVAPWNKKKNNNNIEQLLNQHVSICELALMTLAHLSWRSALMSTKTVVGSGLDVPWRERLHTQFWLATNDIKAFNYTLNRFDLGNYPCDFRLILALMDHIWDFCMLCLDAVVDVQAKNYRIIVHCSTSPVGF